MQHEHKTPRYLTNIWKKSSSLGFLITSYLLCAMRRRDSTTDRDDAGDIKTLPTPTNPDAVLLSFGPYTDTWLVTRAQLLSASPLFPSLLAAPSFYTETGTPCIEWPLSSFSHQGSFPSPSSVMAFGYFVLWMRDQLPPLPRKRVLEYEDFRLFGVYLDVYNLARKLQVGGLQEWVLREVKDMLDACEDLEVPGLEHVAAQYPHRREYAGYAAPGATATEKVELELQKKREREAEKRPRSQMSTLLLTHYCTNLATEHLSRLAHPTPPPSTKPPPRPWEPWLRKRSVTTPSSPHLPNPEEHNYEINTTHAINSELGVATPRPPIDKKEKGRHRLWLYDEFPGLRLDVARELGKVIKVMKEGGG